MQLGEMDLLGPSVQRTVQDPCEPRQSRPWFILISKAWWDSRLSTGSGDYLLWEVFAEAASVRRIFVRSSDWLPFHPLCWANGHDISFCWRCLIETAHWGVPLLTTAPFVNWKNCTNLFGPWCYPSASISEQNVQPAGKTFYFYVSSLKLL